MNARETILSRIRHALRRPTAPTVRLHTHEPPINRVAAARAALPPVPTDFEARCQLFAERAALLRATFVRVPTHASLVEHLGKIAKNASWQRIATHDDELNQAACARTGANVINVDAGYDPDDLAACDAGISRCEALIAQTGSVLVSSASSGGRALSILPPHHVALATREQLVGDLFEGYACVRQRYGDDWPSLLSLITGPSRTGDIERTLVLGAHGPRELTIILLDGDTPA